MDSDRRWFLQGKAKGRWALSALMLVYCVVGRQEHEARVLYHKGCKCCRWRWHLFPSAPSELRHPPLSSAGGTAAGCRVGDQEHVHTPDRRRTAECELNINGQLPSGKVFLKLTCQPLHSAVFAGVARNPSLTLNWLTPYSRFLWEIWRFRFSTCR